MAIHKWEDVVARKFSPEELEEIDREVEKDLLEMDLRALRETLGLTQAELAAKLESNQGEVSRLERRRDHLLSTLRAYVEALGGELEVVAKFGDKEVKLAGV